MTETRAAYEAATLESMHTQAAPVAPEPPDMEYTYDAPRLDLVPVRVDELARLRARVTELEREIAAVRVSTEAAAAVYLRSEVDQLRAALAAERVRVAELEAHLAARQRRAELDAGGIGAVCPACGYELDEHGWCAMCTPEEVQP